MSTTTRNFIIATLIVLGLLALGLVLSAPFVIALWIVSMLFGMLRAIVARLTGGNLGGNIGAILASVWTFVTGVIGAFFSLIGWVLGGIFRLIGCFVVVLIGVPVVIALVLWLGSLIGNYRAAAPAPQAPVVVVLTNAPCTDKIAEYNGEEVAVPPLAHEATANIKFSSGTLLVKCLNGKVVNVNWTPAPKPTDAPKPTVAPTQAPTAVPTPTATPASKAGPALLKPAADVCRLDKITTPNEVESAGTQRMEVRGGYVQHTDFYPAKGVKAVSFIVPALDKGEKPWIWHGYGSGWEGNSGCTEWDWVTDAADYAEGRMTSNHSGLVVDMRSSPFKVVANKGNMSNADIAAILKEHFAAMDNKPDSTLVTMPSTAIPMVNPVSPTAIAPAGSCKATKIINAPKVGSVLTVYGGSIVNFWTNEPGKDQTEHKLLVPFGTSVSLLGGGTQYYFPSGCDKAMAEEYAGNSLPAISIAELTALGLVR